MNILSRICDIRPRVKYMMSRIRDNRPMSVKMSLYGLLAYENEKKFLKFFLMACSHMKLIYRMKTCLQ